MTKCAAFQAVCHYRLRASPPILCHMNEGQHPGFTIQPFPRSRRLVLDAMHAGGRKHMIHGLVEFDVTEPRRLLREHKARTGESLSFTAFILHCVGAAVEQDKMIHACRDWRGRLVMFDDVDVNTIVEIDLEGKRFPLAYVVRAVNRRSLRELHDDIRGVQKNPQRSHGEGTFDIMRWYVRLPGFMRRLAYRILPITSLAEARRRHGERDGRGDVRRGRRLGYPDPALHAQPDAGRYSHKAGHRRRSYRAARVSEHHPVVRPRCHRRRAGGAVREPVEGVDRERRWVGVAPDSYPADGRRLGNRRYIVAQALPDAIFLGPSLISRRRIPMLRHFPRLAPQ